MFKLFWFVQTTNLFLMQLGNLTSETKHFPQQLLFSTFYTIIPLNKLKTMIGNLINFCFKEGDKQFLADTKYDATFAKASVKVQPLTFFLVFVFLILVISHFGKSLESPWVLTQLLLQLIYFYIIMRINGFQTTKREIYKKHTSQHSVSFYRRSVS